MTAQLKEVSNMTQEEREARIDLAAAHRLSHRYGWNDGIYNHYTHTLPGRTDRFLVKPHGLLMSEVSAGNLILVDSDGNTLEGEGEVETTALNIHAAIHNMVPSATCVLHIHPPYSTWLTSLEDNRLKMCNQTAIRFYDKIAYDDTYGGLAVAREEGERMAAALGNHKVMMHANHGVTAVGQDVAHAMFELHYLEKACAEYNLVVTSGATPRMIPDEVCASASVDMDDGYDRAVQLSFAAWKRVLDREEPDYAH